MIRHSHMTTSLWIEVFAIGSYGILCLIGAYYAWKLYDIETKGNPELFDAPGNELSRIEIFD